MSNRTLIEINHDYGRMIDSVTFADILAEGTRSGFSPEVRERLKPFGVRVFGTRHHSDAFSIDWAGVKAAEPKS